MIADRDPTIGQLDLLRFGASTKEQVLAFAALPLRPGSVQLEAGCSFEAYIALLNQRVFFWLGTLAGPSRTARAPRDSLGRFGPTFTLRVPLRSLLEANHERSPYLAKCNSGSARHNKGLRVPRGPSTFQLLREASFPSSEAVELSFLGSVELPADTEFASSPQGPWHRF